MVKILADECIHQDLLESLRGFGLDILTTKEANISGAGDALIFDFVVKAKRALLTFDRGFGDIF